MFSSNCIVKKYARNRKRAACMFFRSAKTRVLNKAWSPVRRSRALWAGFDELTITKITRKVNAPNIRQKRAHCARDSSNWRSCLFNTRVYGENKLLGQMKWQDSTKVIITQKLLRIRNWEFQNMWNGMCTMEIIENLKIERGLHRRCTSKENASEY